MADGWLTKGTVRTLSDGAAADGRVTLGRVRVIDNYPAELGRLKTARARVMTSGPTPHARMTQGIVRTIIKGRVDDPKVRAWTYTMDGHDFYVLRLGILETLVFDATTRQWSVFGDTDTELWRPFDGRNWLGGTRFARDFGSNVVVTDDSSGMLYFLAPEQQEDDSRLADDVRTFEFQRILQGQIALRGFDSRPCFGVILTGSIGETEPAINTVLLETSDDYGHTYFDHGALALTPGEYDVRVQWQSLGSMQAPGRLFRITDYGIARIDSLDLIVDDTQDS